MREHTRHMREHIKSVWAEWGVTSAAGCSNKWIRRRNRKLFPTPSSLIQSARQSPGNCVSLFDLCLLLSHSSCLSNWHFFACSASLLVRRSSLLGWPRQTDRQTAISHRSNHRLFVDGSGCSLLVRSQRRDRSSGGSSSQRQTDGRSRSRSRSRLLLRRRLPIGPPVLVAGPRRRPVAVAIVRTPAAWRRTWSPRTALRRTNSQQDNDRRARGGGGRRSLSLTERLGLWRGGCGGWRSRRRRRRR